MDGRRRDGAAGRTGSGAGAVAAVAAAGAGGLAALFAAWRDRLPDPMASHFALDGEADGFLAPAVWLTVGVGLLTGLGVLFAVLLRVGGRGGQRRTGVAAGTGVPVMITVLFAANLNANLDLAEGAAARLPVWWVALAMLAGAAAAAAAWWWAGPDPRPAAATAAGALPLGAGEAAAWSRTAGSRGLAWVAGGLAAAGLPLAVLGEWGIGLVLLAGALLTGGFARVAVVADRHGLRVSPFGLPFPCKRIPLARMESAGSREVRAVPEFGGWGYRVRPGASGVVLRSGPALSVRLRAGREFVVTVSDAATAAELLNGLIERDRRDPGAGE